MTYEAFVAAAIGGILGNLIGALVSIRTTDKVIRAEVGLDRKRRSEDEEARYQMALTALSEEVRINSFPERPINEILAIFVTDSWNAFKPYVHRLEEQKVILLTRAYSKALSHQAAAGFGRAGQQNPYGGTVRLLLEEAIANFKELHIKLKS